MSRTSRVCSRRCGTTWSALATTFACLRLAPKRSTRVRGHPPDLLLLDLMLPGVDGLEVCRAIRADAAAPSVSHLPILMLTARDDEIDKVVGLEMGCLVAQ